MKDFRKELISRYDPVPCANGLWNRKFGLQTEMVIAIISNQRNKATGSTMENLRNIYPTDILLCEMKVTDDQTCS